ncbi:MULTISPECIES: helix-turn-helix domain-containing protein [Streptococcus]|uniref:helix-turn-helix domain-containing protein n=1 Tax=Streptococcus TaxID=1301 RepID=UPI00132FD892|nr:helix-turn-helix transcriptional regulator [Streptococcus canis]MDV6021911.1 helix-turn-helix transcriptional regulator [Streptococcus canis]
MNLYEYIGEQIRHRRKLAGMSQGELAKKLETNQPTMATIERGKRKLSMEDLVKLRKIFNISADDFLPKD